MINPSDPFRFEDRTGNYGTAQADLAPVSPIAALPRLDPSERPVDPMGASPDQDEGRERQRDDREGLDAESGEVTAGPNPAASAEVGAQTSMTFAAEEHFSTSAAINTRFDATASVARQSEDAQTTTFQTMGTDQVAAVAMAPADPIAPQGSGTPVTLLAASATDAAATQADFAMMAMRMNEMMADMAARVGSTSPGATIAADEAEKDAGPDTPDAAFGNAQDRLDALFDGLRGSGENSVAGSLTGGEGSAGMSGDVFADGQTRIEDLLADIGPGLGSVADRAGDSPSDPLEDARDRLDAIADGFGAAARDSSETEASATPSLLARLFDGEDASPGALFGDADQAEPFEAVASFVFAPPPFDPGRWDDLPDFG